MVNTPTANEGNGAKAPPPLRPGPSARIVQGVAFVLTLAATLALLYLPLYSGSSSSSTGGHTSETATLLQENSPNVLIVLAVPLVLTLLPPCVPRRAWLALSVTCLIGFAAFVFVSLLSIGWFYLPALVLSLLAVLRPPRPVPAAWGTAGGAEGDAAGEDRI